MCRIKGHFLSMIFEREKSSRNEVNCSHWSNECNLEDQSRVTEFFKNPRKNVSLGKCFILFRKGWIFEFWKGSNWWWKNFYLNETCAKKIIKVCIEFNDDASRANCVNFSSVRCKCKFGNQ